MKISTVSEMRAMDKAAIEKYGIVEHLLMENAGLSAFFVIENALGIRGNRFTILCGVGNNGGDGLVIARKIKSNGGQATVHILGDASRFKGAARLNYEIAEKIGLELIHASDTESISNALNDTDVIVDAIFGTGLDREVSGRYADIIEMINESACPVVSVDIPSGVHGDTGQVMGCAVQADYTVTFGGPKVGNLLYPGYDLGGTLYTTYISFPPELHSSGELKIATNDPMPLAPRRAASHKGDYGKILFIAGSSSYMGAPYFAAMSFLKAGGGLSFLAAPESISPFIANKGSEIIMLPQKETATGSIHPDNKTALLEFAASTDMVVMGPGLSLNEETRVLVRQLAAEIEKPLLIDGDGITAVAEDPGCIRHRKSDTILTPHPGEMSRLVKKEIPEIASDRTGILQNASTDLKSIIVLKGAHSLIGYPDERVFINLSGNPGMATAGSGDVLTGTIAAMRGLGMTIEDAVRMGVFVHGFAGDIAAETTGADGLLAGDIMESLPDALTELRTRFNEITGNHYHSIYTI
ncbi:MAG: NAD(P)H-hydrate dehydratase [candidate division KSB1 bacterium]|jgi:NAD(P)H-hydrate epimerase|nr:NAD(P)H-hydrate dehydratase [candidate division KSB1 bacterium]